MVRPAGSGSNASHDVMTHEVFHMTLNEADQKQLTEMIDSVLNAVVMTQWLLQHRATACPRARSSFSVVLASELLSSGFLPDSSRSASAAERAWYSGPCPPCDRKTSTAISEITPPDVRFGWWHTTRSPPPFLARDHLLPFGLAYSSLTVEVAKAPSFYSPPAGCPGDWGCSFCACSLFAGWVWPRSSCLKSSGFFFSVAGFSFIALSMRRQNQGRPASRALREGV